MARKKKLSPEESAKEQAGPQEPTEDGLYLTQEEMLRMQLYEEEAVAGDAQTRLFLYEKDAYLLKIDPQGKLGELIRGIQESTRKNVTAKQKVKDLKSAIEARLNIKLEEYAYNEETGKLQKPEI